MKANAPKRKIFDAVDMLTEDPSARVQREAEKGVQMLPVDQIEPPDSSDSIGLYNIQQRIQLIYGPPYYMRITSHPGEGTCVHLCLPLLPAD